LGSASAIAGSTSIEGAGKASGTRAPPRSRSYLETRDNTDFTEISFGREFQQNQIRGSFFPPAFLHSCIPNSPDWFAAP
jgi:hypothetical protein